MVCGLKGYFEELHVLETLIQYRARASASAEPRHLTGYFLHNLMNEECRDSKNAKIPKKLDLEKYKASGRRGRAFFCVIQVFYFFPPKLIPLTL